MKKIKNILLFLSFLIIKNVFAEVNQGSIYEIPWSSSEVGVFASDETYYSMDYNGWMIVSNTDNNIYYCVEPSLYMQNINDQRPNTHNYVHDEEEMKRIINVDNDTFDRIKLYAFYGYGYKDEKVNHTDKKWYGITQVQIWRLVRPDIKYVYKSSRYGSVINEAFIEEENELNNLVNSHYKVPSFDNDTYEFFTDQEIELTDINDVLYNYDIYSDIDIEVDNNKIKFKSEEEKEVEITFKRKNIINNVSLLTSTNLQNIFVRGNVNTNEASIKIKFKKEEVPTKENKVVMPETYSFNNLFYIFGGLLIYAKKKNIKCY